MCPHGKAALWVANLGKRIYSCSCEHSQILPAARRGTIARETFRPSEEHFHNRDGQLGTYMPTLLKTENC